MSLNREKVAKFFLTESLKWSKNLENLGSCFDSAVSLTLQSLTQRSLTPLSQDLSQDVCSSFGMCVAHLIFYYRKSVIQHRIANAHE